MLTNNQDEYVVKMHADTYFIPVVELCNIDGGCVTQELAPPGVCQNLAPNFARRLESMRVLIPGIICRVSV